MTKLMINPNILDEGNSMEVLQSNEDIMETIVICNNCGQPTKYGETRMCSGYVGCDNEIEINGQPKLCYFDDLMPRIIFAKENDYKAYRKRKFYRWRDGKDCYIPKDSK